MEETNQSVVIPAVKPFDIQTGVKYNHTRQGGEAVFTALITTPSERPLYVDHVRLETDVSRFCFHVNVFLHEADTTSRMAGMPNYSRHPWTRKR